MAKRKLFFRSFPIQQKKNLFPCSFPGWGKGIKKMSFVFTFRRLLPFTVFWTWMNKNTNKTKPYGNIEIYNNPLEIYTYMYVEWTSWNEYFYYIKKWKLRTWWKDVQLSRFRFYRYWGCRKVFIILGIKLNNFNRKV